MIGSLNRFLDTLPRAAFFRHGRETPAYLAMGVAGFYAALVVALAGSLLAGRSVLVMGGVALTCAPSFFAYARLRRWIAGHECLVLLEHVWISFAASAGVLWAAGEPVLPYLDVMAASLCFFLAAGRMGCTLVGCCHGQPSSLGIVYSEQVLEDSPSRALAGVRLFPIPLVEMFALIAIGLAGLASISRSRPGLVLAWTLLAYAIVRFGLEGQRGDSRPHFLGLSQPRWMALMEVAAALWWIEDGVPTGRRLWFAGAFVIALVVGLISRRLHDPGRRLLAKSHLVELREAIATGIAPRPEARISSLGVKSASSPLSGGTVHVSLSLPPGCRDVRLLCELAVRVVAVTRPESAQLGQGLILHVVGTVPPPGAEIPAAGDVAFRLFGNVVRAAQARDPETSQDSKAEPRSWYFTTGGRR